MKNFDLREAMRIAVTQMNTRAIREARFKHIEFSWWPTSFNERLQRLERYRNKPQGHDA